MKGCTLKRHADDGLGQRGASRETIVLCSSEPPVLQGRLNMPRCDGFCRQNVGLMAGGVM